jgi:hypothetical protein
MALPSLLPFLRLPTSLRHALRPLTQFVAGAFSCGSGL